MTLFGSRTLTKDSHLEASSGGKNIFHEGTNADTRNGTEQLLPRDSLPIA